MYSLMGGVLDERLALLHLGYKHMQGLDGFPKDQDMANGYYTNMGKQTSIDHEKVQDSEVRSLLRSSVYTSESQTIIFNKLDLRPDGYELNYCLNVV